MEERLDIIVFGATGFTGKHVLPYLYKLSKLYAAGLTWGIAGRSEEKLKQVMLETAELLDLDNLNSIPIIIADVTNENSVLLMTKRAKVIINCCGPYELYGEVVVKCCIESGTNYVDVTGEIYFQELMEFKYHDAAENKGVYIVCSCGFGSIASELCLAFLEENFKGTLHSVEFFYHTNQLSNEKGPIFNYGTWKSAVYGFGDLKSLITFKLKRNLKSLSQLQPNCRPRIPFTKDTKIGIPEKKIIPFPLSDAHVITRTQRYFYENEGKKPYHVQQYCLTDSWIIILLMPCFLFLAIILAQFRWGKELLLKYPRFFSAGFFDHKLPSKKLLENTKVDLYFHGKGWKNDITGNYNNILPNTSILGKLCVTNPGYGFTCLAVTLSAILLIADPSKLPRKGGVYTPGATFSKTSFVKDFQRNGVQLQVLSAKEF